MMIKKLYYKLVGHRSRVNYWTLSAFANWIRVRLDVEVPPPAASARGWREYKQRNRNKFGYWLVEEGLDIVQDIVMFPRDVYRNVRIKLKNRFIDRPWCLDTKMDKFDWYEMEDRVTYGLFEALVDFVEHEKANMQYMSDTTDLWRDDTWKGKRARWFARRKRVFPSREKGLEYLDWEISLGEESPRQAETAKEVKELYLWWKDTRPNRPEPMDESGWSKYCADQREKCDEEDFWCMVDHEDQTDEERAESMKIIDRSHEIEEQQYEEDTTMLNRLVKIRRDMWT